MRIEMDLLGSMELPDKALYGVRSARIARELRVSGRTLGALPELVKALVQVKKAAAFANGAAQVLSGDKVTLIASACDQILKQMTAADSKQWLEQAFIVDTLHGGGSIGFNVNVNEVIARIACGLPFKATDTTELDAKNDVNASQSTADVCATAFRMTLLRGLVSLKIGLGRLVAAWDEQSSTWDSQETLARTCMQDAMPVSVGAHFSGYAALLKRRLLSLDHSSKDLTSVNLGGTVIGSGAGASPLYRAQVVNMLCSVTGETYTVRSNLFDAAQNCDDILAVGASLSALAKALLKIARDLRLLSSGPRGGLGEIKLPAVVEGSSFFSGKINPVVPETVIQGAVQALGYLHAAELASEQRELNLNVFEGQTVLCLLDATNLLTESVTLLAGRCVKQMEVVRERCDQLVEQWRSDQNGP